MFYWLLILWIVINVFGLYWITHHVLLSDRPPIMVLLAPMWSICGYGAISMNVSLVGRILLTIFYTALFIPAVIVYYALLLAMLVALGVVALYVLIFKKKDKRR